MELVCPECGRAYEIPEHTTQRLFKCLCKFTFNLDQGKAQSVKTEKSVAPTSPAKAVETSNSAASSFSDDQVDDFVSKLRQNKQAPQLSPETKANTAPSTPPPTFDFNAVIEVDEERVIKKAKKPASAEDELTDETTQELPERRKKLEELRAKKEATPVKSNWSESFVENLKDDRRYQIGSGIGVIFLLVFSVSVYKYFTYVPPPPPDPYLGKLLTKAPDPIPQPVPAPTPVDPDMPLSIEKEVTDEEPPSVAKQEKSQKPIAKQNTEKSRSLFRMLTEGRIEEVAAHIENWKKLDLQERAIVAEANILLNEESKKQRVAILIEEFKSSRSDSVTARTLGLFEVSSAQTRDSGIARLQSLQLTRPKDALVSAYLGWGWAKAKRPDQALNSWNQALTTNRNLPWIQQETEELARANGRFDIAKAAAEGLSKLKGFEFDGFFRMGRIARTLENEKDAVQYFKKSIAHKDRAITRLHLAELYIQVDDFGTALKTLSPISKISPTKTEERNSALLTGKAYCGLKKFLEAKSSFERALKLDSNYLKAMEAKADCEAYAGDHARAAKGFERILKKEPQSFGIWLKYGRALRLSQKSNPKAALAAIQRSLEIRETDKAHLEMAYALRALGRKAESLRHSKRAIELNPNNLEARRLTDQIQ